jgi:lysophospholipase L1-like esterase
VGTNSSNGNQRLARGTAAFSTAVLKANDVTGREQPVFIAVTGLFGFGMAEGFARFFIPQWAPATGQLTRFWQYDPLLGWAHVPGIEGVFASHGFETDVKINAAGFRGKNVDLERRTAKKRVLVLGDSLVWGFGVNGGDTVTSKLEQISPDTEAINLAVSGYSTDQELLLYRDLGYRYKADLVVLIVALNDLRGNLSTKEYVIYGKPAFVWVGENLTVANQPVEKTPVILRLLNQAASRSYILTALARIIQELGRPDRMAADGQSPTPANDAPEKGGGRFEKSPQLHMLVSLIAELRNSIHEKQGNVPLLVMFSDGYNKYGEIAAERITELGVETVLLDNYLTAKDPSTHVADLLHWNPAGTAIVAQAISDYIRDHFTVATAVQQPEKK